MYQRHKSRVNSLEFILFHSSHQRRSVYDQFLFVSFFVRTSRFGWLVSNYILTQAQPDLFLYNIYYIKLNCIYSGEPILLAEYKFYLHISISLKSHIILPTLELKHYIHYSFYHTTFNQMTVTQRISWVSINSFKKRSHTYFTDNYNANFKFPAPAGTPDSIWTDQGPRMIKEARTQGAFD